MSKVNFDEYAADYNNILQEQLHFFGEKHEYFAEYKVMVVFSHIKKKPRRILEYGCGTGRNLTFLQKQFPDSELFGCDISEHSLALAAERHPEIHLFLVGQQKPGIKFDLIFIANVFHHIRKDQRLNSMRQISTLLEREGEMFIFEHNPYNPLTRYLVNTCPFDTDAVLLPPKELRNLFIMAGLHIQLVRYTLFFPRFLKVLRFLEDAIGHIPLGGQYFIQAMEG